MLLRTDSPTKISLILHITALVAYSSTFPKHCRLNLNVIIAAKLLQFLSESANFEIINLNPLTPIRDQRFSFIQLGILLF